jgi:hypothetical protein
MAGFSTLGAVTAVLAVAAVVASSVAFYEVESTRSLATEVDTRAAELASGQVLRQVDGLMIQMLAEASASSNDTALRDMLARNGVSFKVNAPAAQPANESTPASPTK